MHSATVATLLTADTVHSVTDRAHRVDGGARAVEILV